jgi:C4-type Zn-finger protein
MDIKEFKVGQRWLLERTRYTFGSAKESYLDNLEITKVGRVRVAARIRLPNGTLQAPELAINIETGRVTSAVGSIDGILLNKATRKAP